MKTISVNPSTLAESALVIGEIPPKPWEVEINQEDLQMRRDHLIGHARWCLWNPTAEESDNKSIFAVGMECGQYGLNLAEVLAFGKYIGCHVIQPSANQIDLARAATDESYRFAVWQTFKDRRLPLTSVSIHCDAYAALAILDNQRAIMFTPTEIASAGLSPQAMSEAHIRKLGLMIIGAAQLGIPALHLFWGMPDDLKPYGWPPQKPEQVSAMRAKFAASISPLVSLAERLGIVLCHEIHFGTIAMTADDLIEVWRLLGFSEGFAVGFDSSHFWHGETWLQAMDKLRKVGLPVYLAHAKNAVVYPGRPMLGLEMDDRLRGMSFTSLDNPAGLVSMWDYLGALTLSGLVDFWFVLGLPAPVYVEAENPFFRINEVTAKGVKYLRGLTDGLELPKAHFTDAMSRQRIAEAKPADAEPAVGLYDPPDPDDTPMPSPT